jgi:HK97 gp10 family phage protein
MIKITKTPSPLASPQVPNLIKNIHTKHTTLLKATLVRSLTTGKRSGRIYTIGGSKHTASSAGEAPAKVTGNLARSVTAKVIPNGFIIGETAPYARYLEFGTRKMEARPHVKPVIDAGWIGLEKLYRDNMDFK